MRVGAVLLCAGKSRRMGENKLLACLGGKTVMRRALEALLLSDTDRVAIVVNEDTQAHAQELKAYFARRDIRIVHGGARRQDSVYNGLKALDDAEIAVIQDAARCLTKPGVINASIAAAKEKGSGVAAVPAVDSLKRIEDGKIAATLERKGVWAMQTPQTFQMRWILRAYESGMAEGVEATDDAALVERLYPVHIVESDNDNFKLTVPDDLRRAEALLTRVQRVGFGEDYHRLTEGRKLILCGVQIPFVKGLMGHSDADVAAHAVMDALLGAAALGDIGRCFPPDDPAYENADSMVLLRQVADTVTRAGYSVGNVDCTIIAERPKLLPHIDAMRLRVAEALGIAAEYVGVKATTTEGLGTVGRGEGIAARCAVLILGR